MVLLYTVGFCGVAVSYQRGTAVAGGQDPCVSRPTVPSDLSRSVTMHHTSPFFCQESVPRRARPRTHNQWLPSSQQQGPASGRSSPVARQPGSHADGHAGGHADSHAGAGTTVTRRETSASVRRVICHGSHARSLIGICLMRDWYSIAEQLAPAPHLACPEGRNSTKQYIFFVGVGCVSCRNNAPCLGHATVKRRRFSYVIHRPPRAYGRDTPRALGPRKGSGSCIRDPLH